MPTNLLLACIILLLSSCAQQLTDPPSNGTCMAGIGETVLAKQPINGICWVGGDTLDDACFNRICSLGVNYIQQIPFNTHRAYNAPGLDVDIYDRSIWAESTPGLIHTAELANARGIKTMLKPHLWVPQESGKWRSDIAMENEADWQEWFANYTSMMLDYAAVAEQGNMESLCIGTELHQTVKLRPDDWRAMIKKIREVYHGKLTYAANFYQEYEDVTFWDALDFIGIQGYFPLTEKMNPTVAELEEGWKKHAAALETFAALYNKPIVFTEIGYKSTRDAGIKPWEWTDWGGASYADTSEVTQACCYEAMFRTFEHAPWMDGVFLWKWYPENYARSAEYETARKARVANGNANRPQVNFSPQHKAAEKVMQRWFKNEQE